MTSFYTRQQCGRNVHDVIFISINWKTAHLTFSPELQAKLEQAELKNLRLTEVFKKTSRDIREVCCYQLLGYKFDIPGSNQYRLMSMYAESPNDYLLFQVKKVQNLVFRLYERNITSIIYVSLRLRVQNAVSPQPCVGKFRISLVLLTFLHGNFRLWFETP